MNKTDIRKIVEEAVEEVLEGWSEGDHPRGPDGKFSSSEQRDSKGRTQKNRDAEDKLLHPRKEPKTKKTKSGLKLYHSGSNRKDGKPIYVSIPDRED